MTRDLVGRVARRVFAALTRWYPAEFRDRFGDDMRSLFDDQLRDAEHAAGFGVRRFLLRTFAATVASLAAAWWEVVFPTQPSRYALPQGDSMLMTIGADVRYAVRSLRKQPLFTLVAIAVIAIGTGAVTTIASAVNAMILRPLPGVTDPDRLIAFDRRSADGREGSSASYHLYERMRDRAHTLTGVAAWSKTDMSLSTGGAGTTVAGNIVSGNFFSVLGLRPALGRFFVREEDSIPLTHPVVVVS
ncbi:MAG TPA: ABC transporter permease, partial [Gemmatimonadaceae bacterium]